MGCIKLVVRGKKGIAMKRRWEDFLKECESRSNQKKKMTPEQLEALKADLRDGKGVRLLARETGRSRDTIRRIRMGMVMKGEI